MFCVPRRERHHTPAQVSLICTVSDAISPELGGEVRLQISDATPPVEIEWLRNGSAALLELSPDRRRASRVPPGIYEVFVVDAAQNEISCRITVQLINILSITGYEVTHATGDTARDGTIRVYTRGANVPQFLWSNGVTTYTPELNDVPPGRYFAAPLVEGREVAFLHECAPATVYPSRHACTSFL